MKYDIVVEKMSAESSLTRATQDDAAFDITASVDGIIEPLGRSVVGTGIKLEMPPTVAALVHPRSGLAAKNGVTVLNTPGLIDPGYRGEIKVILLNTDQYKTFRYSAGDRIAQIRFVDNFTSSVRLHEGVVMDDTERGEGGLGSTGV
jgi:dUTP pyrophosphatase